MFILTAPRLDGWDLKAAVERAREAAGLKHEALAALMGITHAQLSQQLAGQGHLSLPRLLLVARDPDGRAFWQHLLPQIAEWVGVEHPDSVAAELHDLKETFLTVVDRLQVRMLKADEARRAERRKGAA